MDTFQGEIYTPIASVYRNNLFATTYQSGVSRFSILTIRSPHDQNAYKCIILVYLIYRIFQKSDRACRFQFLSQANVETPGMYIFFLTDPLLQFVSLILFIINLLFTLFQDIFLISWNMFRKPIFSLYLVDGSKKKLLKMGRRLFLKRVPK